MMHKIWDELALWHCVTWTYKGKNCGIDPYYSESDGKTHYDMWYGERSTEFSDENTQKNITLIISLRRHYDHG